MATENQKTVADADVPKSPSDADIFASDVQEELSERDVFVGNEDFFKSLTDSARSEEFDIGRADKVVKSRNISFSMVSAKLRAFSAIQKTLAAGILLIAAILLFTFIKPRLKSVSESGNKPVRIAQPLPAKTLVESSVQEAGFSEPLSLNVAASYELQGDYKRAYDAYNQLYSAIAESGEGRLLRDFLQLKMAFCLVRPGNTAEAERIFISLSQSDSPLVRALANYHRSLLELQKGRYLPARTRAYQVLALIEAVGLDENWASLLHRNCHFIAAESMTRYVLSLRDADKNFPKGLWSNTYAILNPFGELDESQVLALLEAGSEKLNEGLLGPRIRRASNATGSMEQPHGYAGFGGGAPCWSVVCNGAPFEELLARFAADAGLDVRWVFERSSNTQPDETTRRQRAVILYLPRATLQNFLTVAAGSVGLTARLDDNPTAPVAEIFNPTDYSSLNEHISLISSEAASLWRRFLLKFYDDQRIANAHFALGLLNAQKGQLTESIAEYKLVANRFYRSFLAPFALLRASVLKTDLHDYSGARETLNHLIEQYPDAPVYNEACLYLADATMKAGFTKEAGELYGKVYHLGLAPELQTAAAIGAGRCFYETGDYQAADKWLNRYATLNENQKSGDSHLACFLLGKTKLALNKPQQACEAFQSALKAESTQQEYADTVCVLVETLIHQERFIEALEVLEDVHSASFSQKEFTELLLLKCEVLRSMGLSENAIILLSDRIEYISDSELKAKASLELNRCHIAGGQLELAYEGLTETLVFVDHGHLAGEVAFELADVCLKLGRNSQAVSVCLQLLNLGPPQRIKQKTLNVLAAAYKRQKNYDRAAAALLGKWDKL